MNEDAKQNPESSKTGTSSATDAAIADAAFSKLPILGPVAWLYARTQDRRFLFLSDLDWAVMPPVVLDQCRLFMRAAMPFAFVTWARVNEEVHQRLLQGQPKLAPHEWNSGNHTWLIDVVTPFGDTDQILGEVQRINFAGAALRYLSRDPVTQKNTVHTFASQTSAANSSPADETGVS